MGASKYVYVNANPKKGHDVSLLDEQWTRHHDISALELVSIVRVQYLRMRDFEGASHSCLGNATTTIGIVIGKRASMGTEDLILDTSVNKRGNNAFEARRKSCHFAPARGGYKR